MRAKFAISTGKWFYAAMVAVMVLAGSPRGAHATIIFNDSNFNNTSTRGAGSSPLSLITVAAPTAIDDIAVLVDLNSAGNLKFVVYDKLAASFLLITGAEAFADDGLTFKQSNPFAPVTLLPGDSYLIGAVADVGGLWAYLFPPSPFTQNGVTNQDPNGNILGFGAPIIGGNGAAQIPIRLSAVPEPTTFALVGLGLAGLVASRRRKR